MPDPTPTNPERPVPAPESSSEPTPRKTTSILPWLLLLLAVALLGWYLLGRRSQDVSPAPTPAATLPAPTASEPGPDAETSGKRSPDTASTTTPRAAPATPTFSTPERIVGQSPEPEYPAQSLRRGEAGTVLLRVNVGADGRPATIDFARRSGSRELDQAAHDAVGRWRFSPAMRNGKPVAAVVEVPVEFKPQQ